ncbi:plasmid pRiA4b ORF-3 family protein [Mycobacterium sp. NPDC003449]
MKTTRLRVVMRDVEPEVSRVIDVPTAASLPELHDLLQAALGWTDSHLHQFVTAEATYGLNLPGMDVWPEDQRDETSARLADLGPRFEYLYDFGDDWAHDVEVLGPGEERPGCVDGHGACPPEDCGGPRGYAGLLEVLADPAHPEHAQMRSWVGNRLRPFDRDATDQWVRRVVGEVPESVRLLFALIADGVKLTPGGRLPRTLVRAMQEHRPHWYLLDRPAAIEEDLMPLAALHGVLRRVGLLRLRRGLLAPTRAAADDLAVVRRLRSAFEPNIFTTEIAELIIGAIAQHGPCASKELAAHVYPMLGYGWQINGRPLTEPDVERSIVQQSSIMRGLDLIGTSSWRAWDLGPSAYTLLPRSTMLAEIWARE